MTILIPRKRGYTDKKPATHRPLDTSHWAHPNLISSLDFLSPVDNVTGDNGTLVSTAEINSEGLEITGVWGETATSADRLTIDSQAIRDAIDNDEWTYFCRFKLNDLTSNCVLCEVGSPSVSKMSFSVLLRTTGEIDFSANNGSWHSVDVKTLVARTTTDWHDLAIIYDGTNLRCVYDRVAESTVAFPAANFPATDSYVADIGSGQRSSLSTNYYSEDHTQEYFRFFDGALSVEECIELQKAPYQILKPKKSFFFVPEAGGTEDTLLADDLESTSEVTSPAAGQEHALTATSIESASNVTAPVIGQEHVLLSTSTESASEVTSPVVGQEHALTASSIDSASSVTTPVIGVSGEDALLADDLNSSSNVSTPVISQEHVILADDIESASSVTTPAAGLSHVLTATSIESASSTTSTSIGQAHIISPAYVESVSETSTPLLAQIHAFFADSIESASSVSAPVLAEAGDVTYRTITVADRTITTATRTITVGTKTC